jgi:hypothetical protein
MAKASIFTRCLVFSALSAILSLVSNITDDQLSAVDIGEAHGTHFNKKNPNSKCDFLAPAKK